MNAMHAIIVDLEATCCDAGSIPPHAMEIIEIGAVAVRAGDGAPLAEFQSFVRPVRHPPLTPFCTQLTSIQQTDVDDAPTFPEAVLRLRAWLTPFSPYCWCSWGDYDRKQFRQDCAFHRVAFPFAGPHRNLKTEFVATRGMTKKLGVSEALHALGLKFEGTAHRGLEDARNIARIYQRLC
ncbi:MAG: inhibitor of the KinA pathway to sporulation exonuclease [Limisphaerales bacterium]|nr:MAG: inhibitor of the KinA pathway to sporulation exonuclease [Limisphaerales bacterium]TXT49071.1 MAG: inhibitor of the KinA pathway to sporulation exonuclease [Limisphaerales bacterium]